MINTHDSFCLSLFPTRVNMTHNESDDSFFFYHLNLVYSCCRCTVTHHCNRGVINATDGSIPLIHNQPGLLRIWRLFATDSLFTVIIVLWSQGISAQPYSSMPSSCQCGRKFCKRGRIWKSLKRHAVFTPNLNPSRKLVRRWMEYLPVLVSKPGLFDMDGVTITVLRSVLRSPADAELRSVWLVHEVDVKEGRQEQLKDRRDEAVHRDESQQLCEDEVIFDFF